LSFECKSAISASVQGFWTWTENVFSLVFTISSRTINPRVSGYICWSSLHKRTEGIYLKKEKKKKINMEVKKEGSLNNVYLKSSLFAVKYF